ncbi:hypothetical protein UFOVP80_59 [uncultured Caudovirales phage]|uniref:Uncharacterized protein n=1 Tax=uncultured Caudovirales phage TaxID=2100421 RepID=A0A6J5L2R9_9CAUD|nr:hypothetical protein UFOVP80_59 [uncultured Caudovirales phage]
MIQLDPHLVAVLGANQTALNVLSLLPESDMIDELYEVLEKQFEVMLCVFEDKHYGTNNLANYQYKIERLMIQAKTISQAREET